MKMAEAVRKRVLMGLSWVLTTMAMEDRNSGRKLRRLQVGWAGFLKENSLASLSVHSKTFAEIRAEVE